VSAHLDRALRVAIEAASLAGDLAREHFLSGGALQDKGSSGDIVTEVDRLAEDRIVDLISGRFPAHEIWAEERGRLGRDSEWVWIVDPLDGTHNYASGLPIYGVSIALLHGGRPILGVIRDSHLGQTYFAVAGQGAWRNGQRLQVPPSIRPERMTIAWIQGYEVRRDDVRVRRMKDGAERRFKRLLSLWAPSINWAMLARGHLDGVILYASESEDLYAGTLLAQEAGAAVTTFDGEPFAGTSSPPFLVACHPHNTGLLQSVVRPHWTGDSPPEGDRPAITADPT
jgi:myo-inositol-1(or 4)-monophosphatase